MYCWPCSEILGVFLDLLKHLQALKSTAVEVSAENTPILLGGNIREKHNFIPISLKNMQERKATEKDGKGDRVIFFKRNN